MYTQTLTGPPAVFPENYWTTEPETDLVNRQGANPIPIITGTNVKFNTHSLKTSHISISNFALRVSPGYKSSYVN
jgi:hypothetical protein